MYNNYLHDIYIFNKLFDVNINFNQNNNMQMQMKSICGNVINQVEDFKYLGSYIKSTK